MPLPAPQHQLPLLLPLSAICVVLPRGAGSSLSSSSSHMTFDMPSDPSGPLRGCSPRTLTTRALLRHLSPTRMPRLSDTEQLGRPAEASVSGEREDGVKRRKKKEDIKSSSQCEIHPSASGGLSSCCLPGGKVRRVGVECQNTKNKCGTLPLSTPLVTFKCITRNLSHER